MDKHDNLVVGLTHIDLGWKKGRAEMAAMLDIYLEHLCNMLDTYPDFRYVLEQAVHYKDLKTRNLQLFERVKAYLCTGRLEFATGLASTIENNVVCAESFVRNMQIGLRWIKENFGVSVKYCTMIDTFGFPPQMPQVLRQFGYDILLANRLGGYHWEECLSVRGLDHTTLRVFGRDLVSSYVKPGHLCFRFCPDDEAVSRLFEAADRNPAPWTVVVPYTENEVVPSDQILRSMADASKEYRFASLSELTGRIREMQDIPEASADLNPEFSGTFSLRHKLRIINRICEKALLDAEAVQAMLLSEEGGDQIEECWWEMAYTQFHDIITGSHPTAVYLDCLCRMEKVQQCARQVMENTLLFCGANQAECCLTLVNTLPYSRKEEIRWELPWGWEGVRQVQLGDEMVEHRQSDHVILFDAEIPAMSMCPVYMEPGPAAAVQLSSLNCLENE